nr:alpha-(1,6)-fucosyltransferase-like isoform X1 [Procambarus clarkii]
MRMLKWPREGKWPGGSALILAGVIVWFLLCLYQPSQPSGRYWPLPVVHEDHKQDINYEQAGGDEPSVQYEVTRRLVETNLRSAWFFFSNRLKEMHSKTEKMNDDDFNDLLKEGAERISVLQHDLRQLSEEDGWSSWREREARALSELVQRRLHRLQNPPDCATAKKLVCSINHSCGLGCELHHLICCFMAAYGTHRTIVINSPAWSYSKSGWKDVFLPLSETCTSFSSDNTTDWPGREDSKTVLFIGVDTQPKPEYMPLAVPSDISERVVRLYGDPAAWWLGQFVKYVFKLQPHMQEIISREEKSINFQHPIVGVHVRRTDKILENGYHDLKEYMEQVEEYFDGLQIFNPNVTRRIYLASDEPAVYKEAKEKYPQYEILYHKKNVEVVNNANRFTGASLRDFIVDIYFLSRTDYIVVTFLSNVGRLVYEVMHALGPDASSRFYSLDTPFLFVNQRDSFVKARFFHKSHRNEDVSVHPGQTLLFEPTAQHFRKDQYVHYTTSEKKKAKIPDYKVEHIVDVVNLSYPYED